MTDYGDISRARPTSRTRSSFGVTPDAWPGVSHVRATQKTHSAGRQLDNAGVASVVVVPAPTGERVLLLDETHLRRIALADGAGATFYGVDPGTYIALRAESGQAWSVVIDAAGSATVTALGGAPAGTVYLEAGRLRSTGAVEAGMRLVALQGLRFTLADADASGTVEADGSPVAPEATLTGTTTGALADVTYTWARVDSGGTDFDVLNDDTASPTFTIPPAATFYAATTQLWRGTATDGATTRDVIARITLERTTAAPTTARFGTELTGGLGQWGTNPDRAMLDGFTMADTGDATSIGVNFTAASTAGASMKGLIYSDSAGVPGTLLGVGAAVAIPAGGGRVVSTFASPIALTPGQYWIGFVADSHQGQADSGAQTSPDNRLYTSLSYASPPSTPGAPGATYINDLAVYCEYEL